MNRRLIRAFTDLRKTQTYEEFMHKNPKNFEKLKAVETPKINTIRDKEVIHRNASVDNREFFTESSDFDVETFSLKEYFWECIFLRNPTLFKCLWTWLFWNTALFICFNMMYLVRNWTHKISPIGYFEMVSPAYHDMDLIKYKQRLYFKKLQEFD